MKKILFLSVIWICSLSYAEEVKLDFGGLNFLTEINDDNVSIRNAPSLTAKKTGTLHKGDKIRVNGISRMMDSIDNHSGYWLRFSKIHTGEYEFYPLSEGEPHNWVWSNYVQELSNLSPSNIQFKKYIPRTKNRGDSLEILIEKDGKKRSAIVYPHKEPSQSYYTFTFSDDRDAFMYYDIPGTYIWNPKTNEIHHSTYYGYDIESAWSIVTDDRKYLLQDSGTSPGVRGISVRDLNIGEIIFRGSYFCGELNFTDHEFDIVYVPAYWDVKNLDKETVNHFQEYKKTHKPKDEFERVVVKYRYNFVTKKRSFVECAYKYFQ